MSMVKSAQDRVNDLFEKLVPLDGSADTVAGELIRATCRIGYRFLNDGDCIGIDYGNETCNAAARYLCKYSSRKVDHFICDNLWGRSYEEEQIDELCSLVLEDLDNRPELMTKKNEVDMWDLYDRYEDEAYLKEDDDEYWDDDYDEW